jgi:NADPH2:quinone reductase
MRALMSVAPGIAGVAIRDLPVPEPGPGQVRVRVSAASLNFPDLLMLDDRYQVRRERPYLIGLEVAGEVDAVGPGVADPKPGDRVFGMAAEGGLADYVLAPAGGLWRTPAAMSDVEAAGFNSSYATAIHALKQRGQVKPGESMLVLSAGGALGLATVQMGKAYGMRVTAAASTQERVDLAKAAGADDGLVYAAEPTDEDNRAFARALKAIRPGGFDVVADIVGGPYAEPAIRALAWEGRFLILGFVAGIPQIAANLLLLKGAQALGVFCGGFFERDPAGARANGEEIVALYEAGKLKPYVGEVFPLERTVEAFERLRDRKLLGKAIIAIR